MKRENIKDSYREYCYHKERIWEKFVSYECYWNHRLDWRTKKEMLDYKKYQR